MLLYNVACCDVQNFASFPSLPLLVQHSSSTYNFRLVLVCDCDFLFALPPGGVHECAFGRCCFGSCRFAAGSTINCAALRGVCVEQQQPHLWQSL